MKKRFCPLLLFFILLTLLPTPAPVAAQDLAPTVKCVSQVIGASGFSERLDWPILALVGAGEKVGSLIRVREGQVRQGELFDVRRSTDYQRTIVGVVAAGANPRNFGGYNLVQKVKDSQRESGKFGDLISGEGEKLVNAHIWGILSLYVAGESIPNKLRALSWLVNSQNGDGGFSVETSLQGSDVDMTGMALMAFAALDQQADHPAVKKALDYLKSQLQSDGDFSSWNSSGPESIAQVIHGLVMLGIDPAGGEWRRPGGSLVTALQRYRRADGSYSRRPGGGMDFISTYQALAALGDVKRGMSIYTLLHRENAGFVDLPRGHSAFSDVSKLVSRQVLGGYHDGSFRPENPVKRAEFTKMIVAALDILPKTNKGTSRFADLPSSHWATPFILVAVDRGLVAGKGKNLFAPDDNISGAEVMTTLVRALGEGKKAVAKPGEAWYAGSLRVAREKGLLYSGFVATRPATRAQCAYSLMRFLEGR
ncbi:MAG TPA: hypothetical protein GXZ24_03860 [Firmicutes bacterium]|nr:hypothetical protein [Bacillota bacterium]